MAQPMAVRVLDTLAHQPFVVSVIVGPTTPRLVLYFVPRLVVYFVESADDRRNMQFRRQSGERVGLARHSAPEFQSRLDGLARRRSRWLTT